MMRRAYLTIRSAARHLGIDRATLLKLCLEHDAGSLVDGSLRIVTEAEAEALRPYIRRPGNPLFGPGYRPRRVKAPAE